MDDQIAATADGKATGSSDLIAPLNQLLLRALKALSAAGEADPACRIAAAAWSLLRRDYPDQADTLNAALHRFTRPIGPKREERSMQTSQTLDVRTLPPRQRHSLILDACARLPIGDGIVLVNDHDPKPLHYQLEAEHPGEFGWEYLESGPEAWRVRIARKTAP